MARFAGAGRYFYLLKGGHSIGGEQGWQVKNATSKTQREILEALDFRADAEDQILSGGLKPRKRKGIRSRTTH